MRLAALLLLAAAAGCGSPYRQTFGAAPACSGQNVAIVTNNLSGSVDARVTIKGKSAPVTLGVVSAGERREFILPDDAGYVYPYSGTQGMNSEAREAVQIRYECRS